MYVSHIKCWSIHRPCSVCHFLQLLVCNGFLVCFSQCVFWILNQCKWVSVQPFHFCLQLDFQTLLILSKALFIQTSAENNITGSSVSAVIVGTYCDACQKWSFRYVGDYGCPSSPLFLFSWYKTSHMVPSSNIPTISCSKSISTMNTSLMREWLYINSLDNHLIQAKVLKGLNGFLLWAQQKGSMLGR